MPENNLDTFKFRFDVSAYRLLGRELITDRVTAIFELVKNCYDANANEVSVDFIDINPRSISSKIIIKDDGIGMTLEDIQNKWMVIGTSSKRRSPYSPAPYNRRVVGKKGVGRFAVDKLGAKLILKTKKKGEPHLSCLETDWSYYEVLESKQLKLDFENEQKYFTDIENKYWFEEAPSDAQGTILEISLINDVWTDLDIKRVYKELGKLIVPGKTSKYPFQIKINSNTYKEFTNKYVESFTVDFATLVVDLGYDLDTSKQEVLKIVDGQLINYPTEKRPCGFVKLKMFYLDRNAKEKFRKTYPNEVIDGIKVYRDGLIATPFAEYEAHPNKQKDLFGIDKRRWSGFFDKISTRDLLGWVEISEELNPDIIDATNRQDFVDNEAWNELQAFVIEQIQRIEDYLKVQRDNDKVRLYGGFADAKEDLTSIRKKLNIIKSTSPDIQKQIDAVGKDLIKIQATVNKGIKEYKTLEEETKQKEDLLFSLVSLQTYASMLSHITRTSIGKILRRGEFLEKWIPDPKYNELYKIYGHEIFLEMNNLDKAVDFMLKYAKDGENLEEFNIKETLEHIFNVVYVDIFHSMNIEATLEINKDLIVKYNLKSFEDIIDNLLSNSFKFLRNKDGEKLIKCSAIVEKNSFVIYFSNNGPNIEEKDRERIFDVFYTTTADLGGAGLGLFIVKSRIEALGGSISVVSNEFLPTGATFKIELPFK
mgnify:CR=1 FL=1